MQFLRTIKLKINSLRGKELCPAILNLHFKKYTVLHFFNDIFAGLRMFFIIFPLTIAYAIFSGGSPVQGIISICVATSVSILLGGSKYQISSIAWFVSLISMDIFVKYQYKGMLIMAITVALILGIYARIRMGNLLKNMQKSFLDVIAIYVSLIIIISQTQELLGMTRIFQYQNLYSNTLAFFSSLHSITISSVYQFLVFVGSFVFLRIFFKGFSTYCIYLIIWWVVTLLNAKNIIDLPDLISQVTTIGQSFFQDLDKNNLLKVSSFRLSQSAYADLTLSAFAVALLISMQVCSSTSIVKSLTGDSRIQTNMELISTGIANFLSVAIGGLFVAPDVDLTTQNIKNKSKSSVSLLVIALATSMVLNIKDYIFEYIPLFAVSTILINVSLRTLKQCLSWKYFNLNNTDSQIFLLILLVAIGFGILPATYVGFTISLMQFTNRIISIRGSTVRDHDSSLVDFVSNKYGYISSKKMPRKILDKIELVQIDNILHLNSIDRIIDAFTLRCQFPNVIIIYFKNVPFLDGYAFDMLKNFVKTASKHNAIVMVSGTNGLLLDILKQKAKETHSRNIFGYVVPNFATAIGQIMIRIQTEEYTKKLKKKSLKISFGNDALPQNTQYMYKGSLNSKV